jgi:cell division protein FtsW
VNTKTVGDPAARYMLLGGVLFLTLGGLVMIYSASSASDFVKYSDSAYHLKSQLLYIAAGLVAMIVLSRFDPSRWRTWGWWILIASDVLLIAVLVIGTGKWGATRWLDLGFTNLQPSEFAKLGCILTVAGLLADRKRRPRPLAEDLKLLGIILGPVVLLIMMQPDMGTTMTILVSVFFLLVMGGFDSRFLWGAAGVSAVVVPALIMIEKYRAARFLAFLNPWADPKGNGYQIIQAMLAFGSGGLTGVGLGLSRQKFFYLPAAHTDFIFAIVGEELGLVGTLSVVGAFLVIAYAGIRIALSVKDPFSRLVAGGLTIMIVAQGVMNMAAVTGIMPVTGIPLPLVSYGGSSMLFTLGCVGLILAVSRSADTRARSRSATGPKTDEERWFASTGERRGDRRPRLSSIDGGRASARRRA